ncbi:mevalonate kinase-like [Nylanderia fulva]|uniref:mevalonate kinase-like n=1 Tax=Nylanderia fulva TaxID=613905 RepID=UPI0010FBA7BD|nr:mevalonate kinase-like [Nylanderia fulva]XP_029172226.1 mevalonate kinase-like [Nylanderia fulva]
MASFKISAPGRIVLSGEHSAMYGKRFVMAGLDLRTNLEFCELPMSELIKIDFPRVHLQNSILHRIVADYFSHEKVSEIRPYPIDLLRYVNHFIDMNHLCDTREQRFSLQMFFYLFCMIKNLAIKPFYLRVFTNLPSSPGLGSSTSFAVCLAACFLHWKRLQEGDDQSNEFNHNEIRKIRNYAKSCEEILQDHVIAAIDAQICITGRLKSCLRKNYKEYITETLYSNIEVKLLLIDSTVRQKREERAQQIAGLTHSPSDFNSMLNKLVEMTKTIFKRFTHISSIANINDSNAHEKAYKDLQADIMKNQQLLKDNNLSHEEIDRICSIGTDFGLAGKLTGFGGGYVYFLLPLITKEDIKRIETHLLKQHFNYIFANIDHSGLRIDK